MTIRPETAADQVAIRGINVAAFAGQPYSRQTEHLIVEALRAAGAPARYVLCLPLAGRVPHGDVAHHPAFDVGAG